MKKNQKENSDFAHELYALLDEAAFYVEYRKISDSEQHRFWVASQDTRKKLGQPSRRPGKEEPDDDCINVLEGDVLIIDINGNNIRVSACRHAGGFGPGDYQNVWTNPMDAFMDVKTLLLEKDVRMQAKEAGRQLHPSKQAPVDNGSLASLKESLNTFGFVLEDVVVEVRDTVGRESSHQSAVKLIDGEIEPVFVFLHPLGFWCVRSFKHCSDRRRFGDFEHYWANESEVVVDIEDFFRKNELRQKALKKGIELANQSSFETS